MILVTGATGNVGRNIVAQLVEAGEKVRASSRNPGDASFGEGVEAVRADLADPDTFPAALTGVDRAFVFPGTDLGPFLAAAKKAGLKRVVLLSSASVLYDEPNAIGLMHLEHERAVAESGLPWTYVRPGAFMANDLAWARGVKSGVVRAPFGAAGSAPIDERDIAAVAVRALLDDGHEGKGYHLSGPESLTVADRVRILGEVLGRDVRFEEQSRAEARAEMVTYVPEEIVDGLLDVFESLVGKTGEVLPTVEQVTGRPAHTYADWVAYRAADFS
jgi:uncharacterized protein YbjT (DUF2867 family)